MWARGEKSPFLRSPPNHMSIVLFFISVENSIISLTRHLFRPLFSLLMDLFRVECFLTVIYETVLSGFQGINKFGLKNFFA